MVTKTNPRKDFTQTAFSVFEQATDPKQAQPIDPKKKAALEGQRRGGLKGGINRASSLTPEQRAAIAKIAATARWKKSD